MSSALKWLLGGAALLYLYNKVSTAFALMKTNLEITGFRFFSIKWDYTLVDLDVTLQNLSENRVVLNGLQLSLFLNNEFVGSSSQSLGDTVLDSYQMATVRARVQFRTSKLIDLLGAYLSTNASKYSIGVYVPGRLIANGTSYRFAPSFYVRIPTLVTLYNLIKNMFTNKDTVTDIAKDDNAEVTEITTTTKTEE